ADVTVGAPIANRDRPELEELIGCFANIQVQRSRITGDPCFEQVLEQTKATAVTAYDHQDLPFEKLVEHLRLPRDLSRNPLFQVIFTLQSSLESELVLSGLTVEPIRPESQTTHLDLELSLARTAGSFHGVLIYATDLFDDTTIQRFGQQIRTLFAAATRETARPLSQMPLLTAPQRHQLRVEWNDTAATGATEGVEQLFEAQASRSPEAIAATCGDEHLSYGELARRARALARRLRRLGVGPEVIVGVGLERSLRVLEAIFGILRSGGAYLPLDPSYPPQRLRFMLDDARVPLVLTETRLVSLFGQGSWRFLPLDAEANDGTDRSLPELPFTPPTRDPRRLAYVIYTSGSTGRPKGVLVSHPSLVNFLGSMRRCPGLAPGDVLAAVTPLSFDIAGLELLLPILVGARLVLVERQVAVDGFALAAQLAASSANALQATPATWRLLTAVGWQPPPGFAVLCGGEALPAELATELIAPGAALWNLYGPTETTVWSTCERLAAPGAVTIGRPIARTSIHLLDRWLRPVVPGAIGELCIGGRGLARGYLRRPARSAEVFLPDPWSGEPGGRLYRSGDLARYASEGRLLCLGRIDHQVKLRGRRLELGEIETVLAQDPAVTAAVVVVREKQPGDPRLIAYVELRQPSDDWAERLRSQLRRQLPGDMVPALFLPVESWPLSPAGKIDRRALRQRPWPRSTAGQTVVRGQPQSDLEKTLAAIWCEILGRDAVGMEENFFDLGGHSLLLVEVRQRLIEALGREISIVDLFRYPNLRSLVRLLAPHDEADTEPSPRGVPQPADASEPPSANESPAACIAIIGMAGRFPGAETVGQFWHNLCAGVESISFFSDEELLAEGYSAEMLRRPECIKARGTIDGIDLFDAKFFGFTRRDAEITDPQQRLFLETAYSALEDAGHPPEHCQRPVGIFAGASRNSYFPRFADDEELRRNVGDYPLAIGNDADFLATRTSYKLDLKGPSVTLQTACSTSLVAVHFACESLRRGECDMALAGGVGLEVPVKRASLHQAGGILARDGHCRAFDARAAGTVAGQGLGIVVLKRLVEAQRDGDSIRAVILGSAINNDGAGKVGYTAPSVDGQAAVIEAALAAAHVEPATIGYVEAHGTGTKLGDPLEVAALQQAFASVPPDHRCALGSVKTNIGHLDTAAGVAGLIKASLAVENGFLPPSLHCQQPNPEIDFAAGPFRVNQQPRPWASAPQPRRAGVSSFGIGGTNVHMVLEEPPPIPPADAGRARQLLVLSGRTLESLQRSAARLADHLETAPDTDLADAAYTLQVGRRAFGHRRVLVCAERDAAIRALRAPAATGLAGETPGAR
ncbi:MAG: amino acid adenylation domain-containing protein, partial [Acidobacteriota bacterium]